jgi:hypothetical protein
MVDFYAHPNGLDGRMSKCKECHKASVREWYGGTRTERAAYERVRAQKPDRKADTARHVRAARLRSPEKYKARTAVGNALRDGRLRRMPCEVCGSMRVQAHHADYSKPLDVRWLCFKHHREHEHGQVVVSDAAE